jgi:segregation and condensation protein A
MAEILGGPATEAIGVVQEELDWKVKLPVFEGPLDLLLYLIRREEIDIYQIPMERITQHYLEMLRLMKMLDLEIAGEYLVMAASLLYIKSRMLLPLDQQAPEMLDEEEAGDPRWELIRQLVEYKKFKEAAGQLVRQAEIQEAIYLGGFAAKDVPVLSVGRPLEVGVFELISAFQKVLLRLQPEPEFEIFEDRFTVSDKMLAIQRRIEEGDRFLFSDLFPDQASRSEIVATFLALLEMIRLRQMKAVQLEPFSEILLVKAGQEEAVVSNLLLN